MKAYFSVCSVRSIVSLVHSQNNHIIWITSEASSIVVRINVIIEGKQ